MQSQTVQDPDLAVAGVWTTSYNYDIVGGQALPRSASIQDGRPRTVSYVSDFLGQVIKRDEADALAGGDPEKFASVALGPGSRSARRG